MQAVYGFLDSSLLTDVMEFHFIEIPKLLRDWKEQKLDPWNDVLARWLLLLGVVNHRKEKEIYEDIYKELEVIAMRDEQLFDALTQWRELSLTDAQYHAYEGRLKHILDEEAAIEEAKMREQEAMEKGIEIGREEGMEIGKEEGATNALFETALQLLQNRFAAIPTEVVESIGRMNAENLQLLIINSTTFTSIEDVERYLQSL
ncbi:PD-(D/E)XK nuclease family transposase [Metasolibacillus sp. FSL K6-0083]|uniref:PD-(D/E)XK nuclease family transposase n=1 Tax=Metasolibacillus sp. FSL K6-0083 TaxID=2921416 RepID=UPI00315A0DC5